MYVPAGLPDWILIRSAPFPTRLNPFTVRSAGPAPCLAPALIELVVPPIVTCKSALFAVVTVSKVYAASNRYRVVPFEGANDTMVELCEPWPKALLIFP